MELYTIGYEGMNQKEFLVLLRGHKISVVADVRRMPSSRKKGFSKNGLAESLLEQGISYVGFKDLGTPGEMRDQLKMTGNYGAFFKKYRRFLAKYTDQLDRIGAMVNSGKRVTLLCYENDPGKCHRMVIAEEVKKRNGNGLTIRHMAYCH